MESIRYNISPCAATEVDEFVDRIDGAIYLPRGTVRASESSHYDRYSYVREELKVTVVYDTVAQVISITGPKPFADDLMNVFGTDGRTVKSSKLPSPGTDPRANARTVTVQNGDSKSKLFYDPTREKYRPNGSPSTRMATVKGFEISTDDIYPPQRAKRRTPDGYVDKNRFDNANNNSFDKHQGYASNGYNGGYASKSGNGSYGLNVRSGSYGVNSNYGSGGYRKPLQPQQRLSSVDEYLKATNNGENLIPVSNANTQRKITISLGESDYDNRRTRFVKPSMPARTGTGLYADLAAARAEGANDSTVTETPKKKRGRPRKDTACADIVQPVEYREMSVPSSGGDDPKETESKKGYILRNFTAEKLNALLKRLKNADYTVKPDATENANTPQEIKPYIVSKGNDTVKLRFATTKDAVQLLGERSETYAEVQSLLVCDSDYLSAIEGYIKSSDQNGVRRGNVSDVQNKLKRRLPVAFDYLSEQSRIELSYGIHDFSKNNLGLSDYSVLLIPPYRGLEQFIFDLQRLENIKVKLIGQAYDKTQSGAYTLKYGYAKRIDSVIFNEVMVALYTEYFSRRNFITHSDNSDEGKSRAILDRAVAKGIFENLLDVIEYNAKKLKEIGYVIKTGDNDK